jgi:hypothetical protein
VRSGILFLLGAAVALAQVPDCGMVPGWAQQGKSRTYAADNLFEYMDGNAEGYLIYRFVRMNGVNCKSGDNVLAFDVFEMADPEWAYGVFASNRDPRLKTERVGVAGQVSPRRMTFVKDKYFAQISSETDQAAALAAFARALDKSIPGTSEPPAALAWFPSEKLVPDSIRLVPESVLGMRVLKRGYVAQYEAGKAFLVLEATPESAAAVMTKLRGRIAENKPAAVADEGLEANDKYLGHLCFFRKGRYIGGFSGLQESDDAAAAAARLAANVK